MKLLPFFFVCSRRKNEEADLGKIHDEHWKIDLWLRLIGFRVYLAVFEPQKKIIIMKLLLLLHGNNVHAFNMHYYKINEQSISKAKKFLS